MATETNFTGYVDISAMTMTENKLKALDFLQKNMVFLKLGTQENISRNSGQTISTWRPTTISAQTTAFNDGGLPSSIQTLAGTSFTATIANYGAYCQPTDLLEMTGRDPGMKKYIEVLQYNAALTLDTLCYNEFATSTAHYGGDSDHNSSTTFDSSCTLTGLDLRRLRKKLAAKDAPRFTDSDRYKFIGHPDVMFDLFNDPAAGSYTDAYKHTKPDNAIWKGELKPLWGFDLYESNIVTTATANSTTAYKCIATGAGHLMNVGLEGLPFNLYYVSPKQINQSNPLGTKGSLGWVAKYGAEVIGSDGPRGYLAYFATSEITS